MQIRVSISIIPPALVPSGVLKKSTRTLSAFHRHNVTCPYYIKSHGEKEVKRGSRSGLLQSTASFRQFWRDSPRVFKWSSVYNCDANMKLLLMVRTAHAKEFVNEPFGACDLHSRSACGYSCGQTLLNSVSCSHFLWPVIEINLKERLNV